MFYLKLYQWINNYKNFINYKMLSWKENFNVFSFNLKLLIELDSLISLGKLFHSLGAANINAWSPSVALDLKLG